MKTFRIAQKFALIAGLLDLLTGACLVIQPGLTLRLMQAAPVGEEATVFLRWIGAFVASVGASYLWALARGNAMRLRSVFEITAIARIFVGSFSAWAIMTGPLGLAWISVPVADLALAALQIWMMRRMTDENDALG